MNIQEVIALVKRTKELVENQELAEHIKVKGPADYVTQVDIRVQNFLKEELSRLAPQIQFLGEEAGLQEITGDSFWILDPIDGTTNLIHGYLHSTVSLGLYRQGEIVMGIVYDPFREDVFWAEKGKGCYLNNRSVRVANSRSLSETIIGVGTTPYQRELAGKNFQIFRRVFDCCQDIRRTGSAAMELAYTACGRQGGYFEACLQPWDYAAGLLLVQEAGGMVTDFLGEPTDPRKAGSVLATNGLLHQELLDLLNA